METTKIQIEGMDCEGCASGIENLLRMKGLAEEVKVDYSSKRGEIKFSPEKTKKENIFKAVEELGYKVKEL